MRYYSQLHPDQKKQVRRTVLRKHLSKHRDLNRTADLYTQLPELLRSQKVFKLNGSYVPMKFSDLINK
jgi:hypothetical protein